MRAWTDNGRYHAPNSAHPAICAGCTADVTKHGKKMYPPEPPLFRFAPEVREHVKALTKLLQYANGRNDKWWASDRGSEGVYGHVTRAIRAIIINECGREVNDSISEFNWGGSGTWLGDVEDAVTLARRVEWEAECERLDMMDM